MIDCSIIIPAYNAEATIIDTLESIELDKQWKYRIEVVVIDDGSSDSTLQVLFNYAKYHPEVHVITQMNTGVSSARNNGIEKASGKYVFFIDSDDKLHRDVLDKMIGIAEEQYVDLVIADYCHYFSEDKREIISCKLPCTTILDKDYLPTIFRRYFVGDNTGLSNLWNKLFKKELIQDHDLKFDERRTHGEDWAFCINCFQHSDSIYAISDTVYEYCLDGSQTRSKYKRELAYCLLDGHRVVADLNRKYLHYDEQSEEFLVFMRSFYDQIIGYLRIDVDSDEKKRFLRTREVRDCFAFLGKQKKSRLFSVGLSRRDKLAIDLLSLGIYKPVLTKFY